jgi:hypothetical protein
MPSKKDIKTTFDEFEIFYIPVTKFRALGYDIQERMKNEFNLLSDRDYDTWRFIYSRIIPIRLKGKMRFFPEVIVERKQKRLRLHIYLKLKRETPNFNYNDYYRCSEIVHVDNRSNLLSLDDLDLWDKKKDEKVIFSYKWVAKNYPKLMCKTLKEAQKRLNKFISKKTLVY